MFHCINLRFKVTRNLTGLIEKEIEMVFLHMFEKIFQVGNLKSTIPQRILKVFLWKVILLKLSGFFVAAITHLASLTNPSLKILENCEINIQNLMINLCLLVVSTLKSEPRLLHFLYECNAKNIVKENTCFKNPLIPSCVDIFIINSPLSFQNTIGFLNGLTYFHKIVIRVMKMSFKKHSSIERHDRDYKYFDQTKFKNNPNKKISGGISNYESFKPNFTEVINKHASLRNSLELVMLYTLLKT